MNRTFVILKHEFLITVRTRAFVILTLLVPALVALGIGVAKIVTVSGAGSPQTAQVVGYVDQTGVLGGFTRQGIAELKAFASAAEANQALVRGEISQYVVIPGDFLSSGRIERFTSSREFVPPAWVAASLKYFVTENLLVGKVPDTVRLIVESPLNLVTTHLDANGVASQNQASLGNALVPLAFSLFLILAILLSSGSLLNGLAEEKENRLMEILISRVTPQDLLVGKFLGIGAAGLLQVAIWLGTLPGLLALASGTVGGVLSGIHVSFEFYVLCVVYFLLGYSVFGILNAALGAVSSSLKDAQQSAVVLNLIPVAPMWLMSMFIAFPQSVAWIILSFFPLTAPTVVIERLSAGEVAPWELAVSLGILLLTAVCGLFLSTRLFRSHLLRYGGRRRLTEAARTSR